MTLTEAEMEFDRFVATRRAQGRVTYGQGLEHTDVRWNWERMALEELADACQYLIAQTLRLQYALDEARGTHIMFVSGLCKALGISEQDAAGVLSRVQSLQHAAADVRERAAREIDCVRGAGCTDPSCDYAATARRIRRLPIGGEGGC